MTVNTVVILTFTAGAPNALSVMVWCVVRDVRTDEYAGTAAGASMVNDTVPSDVVGAGLGAAIVIASAEPALSVAVTSVASIGSPSASSRVTSSVMPPPAVVGAQAPAAEEVTVALNSPLSEKSYEIVRVLLGRRLRCHM